MVASMETKSNPMGLGAGIVMVVGSFAGGLLPQADITRYAKSTKVAWLGTIFRIYGCKCFHYNGWICNYSSYWYGDLPSAMLPTRSWYPCIFISTYRVHSGLLMIMIYIYLILGTCKYYQCR